MAMNGDPPWAIGTPTGGPLLPRTLETRAEAAEARIRQLEEENAKLRDLLRPLAELGTAEGRKGRLSFEDPDCPDMINTKGDTFDEVPDDYRVLVLLPAGAIRDAHAALTGHVR